MATLVQIYPGSACDKQPGRGGWAAVLSCGGRTKELVGNTAVTTNNRMALVAAIKALRELKQISAVHVISNCQYLQKGAKEWLPGWKAQGRLGPDGVENWELWAELDALNQFHFVDWFWVRANENALIQRASTLAKTQLQQP